METYAAAQNLEMVMHAGRADATSSRFYGKYRGTVIDNQDPLKTGRIRAQVPEVTGEADSGWALPCVPFGILSIPPVGAEVWIEFEQGDPDRPLVSGCVWNSPADAAALLLAPPYTRVVIQTNGGHQVVLDDTPGTGGITMRTAGGQIIVLSGTGTEISDGAGGSVKLTTYPAASKDSTP